VTSTLRDQLQSALGQAYVLDRELGGGGMSHVFLAHEQALGRQVVVKVLLPELAAGVNVERFRREIQLAAQLQHPHIVPLLSAGEADGLPYFIMPYVTGESLRTRITREGELPISETVRILRDVVSALAYAHARGVVHRDVKPDNVLLSGGVAVVTDFGVSKAVSASAGPGDVSGMTSLGVALGTPAYMSPEQATASPQTDHRADVYALGVMTYEMLTGMPPFTGRSPQAVLAAHVVEEPQPVELRRPAVPPMLAMLVRQCLAKRPADRPQSASDLMHVLDAVATPSGGTAPTTPIQGLHLPSGSTQPPAVPGPTDRRRWVAAALAAAAVLAVVGVVLSRPREAARSGVSVNSAADSSPSPAADSSALVSAAVPESAPPALAPARAADSASHSRPATGGPLPRRPAPPRRDTAAQERETPPAAPTQPSRAVEPPPVPAPPAPGDTQPSPPPAAPRPSVVADSVVPANPAAKPPPTSVPPPPPKDPRPDIQGVVADYAKAVELESLDELRRVYPGMTPSQQLGWEQFFRLVRDVKADLAVGRLDVRDMAAEAQVAGTYTYLNTSTQRTERQPVAFEATLRREGGRWRIAQIH
jgi:serine/threonine protein kinase